MFRGLAIVSVILAVLGTSEQAAVKNWLKNTLVYQIYPRSFQDSNGDGIGDLNGITSKLEHIKDIGADALWLSPIYTSPQVDFGYDIANFTNVDKDYGTIEDFDKLVAKAKSLGLKVILDFVPNHSSPEHQWFKNSIQNIKPYDEYYIWRDGKVVNGVRQPPNNWLSAFGGSAWEYNEQRKQYYLHQFAIGQPDLNYRSAALNQEMKNALTFWMDHGVEGFRVDAINMMFEDSRFLDEPLSNAPGLPADDYDFLNHIYTRDQNETYEIIKSWRKLLDEHSEKIQGEKKIMLTEAYTAMDLTMRYYTAGSTVPFNFMFMTDLNNGSTAADFKFYIDRWMNNIPTKEYVANWVVGNHDNHRAATRFGTKRADQLNMLAMILPGISVVYNGDEIGMEDRPFTWEETVDTAGCNAGPERYDLKSRDPERTPFQWNGNKNAGFSTGDRTWLPVHSNYKRLNLEIEKSSSVSHYKVFKALSSLKKKGIIEQGGLQVTLVTENVLGVVRRAGHAVVVLLTNFADFPVTVDARTWLNIPEQLTVYAASVYSKIPARLRVNTARLTLQGAASVVLITPGLA